MNRALGQTCFRLSESPSVWLAELPAVTTRLKSALFAHPSFLSCLVVDCAGAWARAMPGNGTRRATRAEVMNRRRTESLLGGELGAAQGMPCHAFLLIDRAHDFQSSKPS